MNPNLEFQILKPILKRSNLRGISIKGKYLIPHRYQQPKSVPSLRHYTDSADEIIQHNLKWVNNQENKPRFKFAYISLPTSCNQRCLGCFTGKDKGRLPHELNGEVYSPKTLDKILNFLKEHNAEAVVYGGGGELFTWRGAFDYINRITNSGLGMVIFTNGTLLSKTDIQRLSEKDISLIISIRDTEEKKHNDFVGINGFRKTLVTLEHALQFGLHKNNRLAVEMPVIKENQERILCDFIPAMRHLRVIPLVEEYIQISTSKNEKKLSHNFVEVREFFKKAAEIDKKFGYNYTLHFGQRMLAQPKCERPLYSFAIYPNGDIMDCPASSTNYGNLYEASLKEIIYSKKFKSALRNFQYCPCSVFFTENNEKIPKNLPKYLEDLKCQK